MGMFETHMLNTNGKIQAKAIADAFVAIQNGLEGICGEGREMAIVRTKLEEACFFAKKAMAMKPENQDD